MIKPRPPCDTNAPRTACDTFNPRNESVCCTFVDTFTNDTGATVDLSDHIADTGQSWVHLGGLTSSHYITSTASYANELATKISQGAVTKVDASLPVPLTFSFNVRHVPNNLGAFKIYFTFAWDDTSSSIAPDDAFVISFENPSNSTAAVIDSYYVHGGVEQALGSVFYNEGEPYNFQVTGSLSDELIEVTFTPTVGDPFTWSMVPEAPFTYDSFVITSGYGAESDARVIVDDLNICT